MRAKRMSLLFALGAALTATRVPTQNVCEYRLTTNAYAWNSNIAAAVVQEFGPTAVVADWSTIKAAFGGNITGFLDAVGLTAHNSSAMCVRNGQRWWSGNRQYFMARHDGTVPGGWLVHDHIASHTLDLGSWYSFNRRILARIPAGTGAGTGQANSATAALTVNGVGATGRGPFAVTVARGSTATLDWVGPPNQPVVLLWSLRTCVHSVAFGCEGQLDLMLPLAIGFDGRASTLYTTSSAGTAQQTLQIPNAPPGHLLSVQGVVFQPAGLCPFNFLTTAAFDVAAQ
ncbi:MAG: hypothetical protein KDC98_05510 [Planctomycetes bacterium]|nr:hypothetical protein [Planctomycetota bacterium]